MFKNKKRLADVERQLKLMHDLNDRLMARLGLVEKANQALNERIDEIMNDQKEHEETSKKREKVTPQQIINEYFYFKEEQLSNGAE